MLQVTSRARRTGALSRCLARSRAAAKSADSVAVGICLMGIEVMGLVFCGAGDQLCISGSSTWLCRLILLSILHL